MGNSPCTRASLWVVLPHIRKRSVARRHKPDNPRQKEDDGRTDPSGNSGDRLACGVAIRNRRRRARSNSRLTITLLGTRGEIEVRTQLHFMHSSLLVSERGAKVMIDCGADWAGNIETLRPDAIVLTHAHPDHAGGLKNGASCPVCATAQTWQRLRAYRIARIAARVTISERRRFEVGGIGFEAFPVEHSIRTPAVGYRVSAGRACLFYAPDLVFIRERRPALSAVQVYIGDGASLTRPIIRKRGEALIGHASIRDQLEWCREESIPRAVFSHCGSQIVKGDPIEMQSRLKALAAGSGVQPVIAHDGIRIVLT